MKIPKTKKISKCRLCFNKKLSRIHNFGNHYISNFVTKNNIKKGISIFFKVYSSSRPVLNSLVDLPKDFARPGKRLAPKSNNRMVKIIKSSGSPNLIC